ncbi:YadA C-terminal domain-containing protein [Edwardsiella tarda]|uniref:YadA C-terminal domain-containing protein n=1 Tax=Edwardsiella tarda TaxID=636 RepID=UPI002443E7BB|nr:YadA C-terminal domain-containing protein [Edwardsiella tarda]WGE29769.1 YadA C-terminal domain-containing protein [Edwardsiella tarda]
MKRHTLAALISSLFVLSSAYGYAASETPSVDAASTESPSASPATTPATLSAAELAAFAKALPQIGTDLIQAHAKETLQTTLQTSIQQSLTAPTYFRNEIAKIIEANDNVENLRNALKDQRFSDYILTPASEYKRQFDKVKAVENYVGYMSSVSQSAADQAAIAVLQAMATANQQDFFSNIMLYNTLTTDQARARQLYDTLHTYTSAHMAGYNFGKFAEQALSNPSTIDTQLENLPQTVLLPAYQRNVIGLLASLKQADVSVKSSLATSISGVTQNAQQYMTQYLAYLADNHITEQLNGAALVAAVQENIQGIENNQQVLAQLQQAHQADLAAANIFTLGAANAVKEANEASIAAAADAVKKANEASIATLNQSLQDNQRAEQQARQADLTTAHIFALGAANEVKKTNEASIAAAADAVKKANDAALRVAQTTNADAIRKVKEANDTAISEAKKTLRQEQENTLAVNLMALGELKRVQDNTNTSSSDAFNAALNDSKRELSAAIQANSHSLSRRIDDNRKKAAAGIAGVAAMSNIPIPYTEGSFTVGVGVGYYDSQSAGAIGIGKGFENGLAIKASASFATDSNVAIGGGASWSF